MRNFFLQILKWLLHGQAAVAENFVFNLLSVRVGGFSVVDLAGMAASEVAPLDLAQDLVNSVLVHDLLAVRGVVRDRDHALFCRAALQRRL